MSIVNQKYKRWIWCIKICGTIFTIVCFLIVGLATHTKEEMDGTLYMTITPTSSTDGKSTDEKDMQKRNVNSRESVATTPSTLEKDNQTIESCEKNKNKETTDMPNEK
ncbi:MAG: hypothetical protein LBP87_01790 [Planctomycetaceae bacterium]|jgi:hypothetical protein|nr:hypothetical protein [Planctomycetaceae bacterium]